MAGISAPFGEKRSTVSLARFINAVWFHCLSIATAAILIHVPALQGERIWDDNFLARDNPFIKSPLLILETFRHYLFLDSFSAHYRPIQNITYIADYFLWNTNTYGFHLTNVLLHAGSGVLLYFLLRQLFASLFLGHRSLALRVWALDRWRLISLSAFVVAVLWVVHPVHSAAVDYISGRADSLAFLFSSAGWLLFLRAQRTTRPVFRAALYVLAAASGFLGLLSREIACVWIVLFVIHLFFVEKKMRVRTRICVVICVAVLVGLYLELRHLPEQRPPSPVDLRQSAPVRAVLMARALGDYGRLMIFPTKLHMERTVEFEREIASNADWRGAIATEYLSILGLAVFTVLIFTCIKKGPGQAVRIFGATWFLAGYFPISNIVQLNATAAEHWLYLPSVGFLVWLSGCAYRLPVGYRRVVLSVAAIAVIGLSSRSFVRSSDWANEEAFYKRTFEAGSRSARVALNLGQIYLNRNAYAQAERVFRSVLEQNPNYPSAQANLAATLYREGRIEEAEKLYAEVEKNSVETRKMYPRTWFGALNLAKLRHGAHDDQSALAILHKTQRDYPNVWDLIGLEAEILRQAHQLDAALQLVETFVRENWWHYGAVLALGQLYAQKGDAFRAEAMLRHASWLDIHDADALRLIALIKFRQNNLEEAFRTERRAIARQPDQPSQYVLLSNILEKMGRPDEARAALAQVSRLRALANNQPVIN
jgi:protein O-mannosyl-transferase